MLVGRQSSYIVLAIVYERQSWQTKDKRPQRSNVNVKNLWQNSQYLWNIVFSVLEEVFEFCWSSLADEHNTTKIDQRRHKIGQIYIWNPMTTGFIMQTLICVISMEFLPLSRRRSSLRNVPSYEERGETDVFAGYVGYCGTRSMCSSSSVFIVRPPFPSFIPADAFQRREALTLRKFNGSCINLLF